MKIEIIKAHLMDINVSFFILLWALLKFLLEEIREPQIMLGVFFREILTSIYCTDHLKLFGLNQTT